MTERVKVNLEVNQKDYLEILGLVEEHYATNRAMMHINFKTNKNVIHFEITKEKLIDLVNRINKLGLYGESLMI